MMALWLWSRRHEAWQELRAQLNISEEQFMRTMGGACRTALCVELLVYTVINLVFHPFA